MWPLSQASQDALRSSATLTYVMEIYSAGGQQLIASTEDDSPSLSLDTTTGSIEVQRMSKFARSFSCRIIDKDGSIVPTMRNPYIDPLRRNWAKFYCVIEESGDRVPLGVFVIEKCVAKEEGDGVTCDVSGNDIATLISDNKWISPYTVASSETYGQVLYDLISDRSNEFFYPTFDLLDSVQTAPPASFDISADPWDEAQKLAQADGKELFVSQMGSFKTVSAYVENLVSKAPVWYYDDSQFSVRLPDLERDIDAAEVYNGVILNATAPWLLYSIIGTAWDTNPNSPTYYLGPMGKKPKNVDNNVVADQSSADAAASVELAKVLGVTENVTFEAVVNPAHEIGDVVRVGSEIMDMSDDLLIETLSLPFNIKTPMKGTCRRRRSA